MSLEVRQTPPLIDIPSKFLAGSFAFIVLSGDPHLISASPPDAPRGKAISSSFFARRIARYVEPLRLALKWSEVSQLVLNYRAQTFGGRHALTAYFMLAHRILDSLPVCLSRFWGRDELMEPFTLFMFVNLLGLAYLAAQAVMYPAVPQVEQEDE